MPGTDEVRYNKIRRAAWIGIFVNIALTVIKGIAGVLANSRALIADAAHSAADVVTSFAVLIGIRAAELPPDEDHPYGHGKAETITSIIVSVLLFIVGFEIALNALRDMTAEVIIPGEMALYVILLSIVVKEGLFRYKLRLGNKYKSDALITDAWHHRSDALSSVGAFIGIGASLLGSNLNIGWLQYGDLAAGVFVAGLVMIMAWKLGKEAVHNALDHVLHEEDTVDMRRSVEQLPKVVRIDEFYAREHGHYVIIDIKIVVNPMMTVREGHDVAKEVKETLMSEKRVRNVLVHVNPDDEEEKDKGISQKND